MPLRARGHARGARVSWRRAARLLPALLVGAAAGQGARAGKGAPREDECWAELQRRTPDEQAEQPRRTLDAVFCLPKMGKEHAQQPETHAYGFHTTPDLARFPFATPPDAPESALPPAPAEDIPCADDDSKDCTVHGLAEAHLQLVARSIDHNVYFARTNNVVKLPIAYATVPPTKCELLDAAKPHVKPLKRLMMRCAVVKVHARCHVVRADGAMQPLVDPAVTAWAYAPDRSLTEVFVRRRRGKETAAVELTFHACTSGLHALHARLDALSVAHAISDAMPHNGFASGYTNFVPARLLARAFTGSPFAINVQLPPSSGLPALLGTDTRPPCDLGLHHAPRNWLRDGTPRMRREVFFRWADDAESASDLLHYHTGLPNSTRRFSPVVHLGPDVTRRKPSRMFDVRSARRAMRAPIDAGKVQAVLKHLGGGLEPNADGRGGLVNGVDYGYGFVGGTKMRWHAYDRYEAHPASTCRLCRHDYGSTMNCLRGDVLLLVGDSTSNRVMLEMLCALSIGNAREIYEAQDDGGEPSPLERRYDEIGKECMADHNYTCRLDHFPPAMNDTAGFSRERILELYPCFAASPPLVPEDAPRIIYASIERFLGTQSRQLSEIVATAGSDESRADDSVADALRRWRRLLSVAFPGAGVRVVFSAGLHDMVFSKRPSLVGRGASILARRSLDAFAEPRDSVTFALANAVVPLRAWLSNCASTHPERQPPMAAVVKDAAEALAAIPKAEYTRGSDPRLFNGLVYGYPGCEQEYHRYKNEFRLAHINNLVWRAVVAENAARKAAAKRTAAVVDWRALTAARWDSFMPYDAVHPHAALVDEVVQLLLHGVCGC